MIVVESRLQELFQSLPSINDGTHDFTPVFDWGLKSDLAILLKQEKKPYPLIYLESGFAEVHNAQQDEVQVSLSFKVATYGLNSTLLNQQRLKGTMEIMLIPLVENIRKAFERSNIIQMQEQEWEITKFYNYGQDNVQEATHVWDAIKFDVELVINNDCLKVFNYG